MDCGGGGWEQTKENILPLSSGRRMAHLTEALPARTATGLTDHLLYEKQHLREVERLEDVAQNNAGDDPLQAWVDVIKYIEQHFPSMSPAVKEKYSKVLNTTLKGFYSDDRYSNDERYIWVVIKSFLGVSTSMQIRCLKDFLQRGKGERVADIYTRLAELYDGEGDTKSASDILREGLKKNAQPRQKLEEMLTHIQETWAKHYAKLLEDAGSGEEPGARKFAASVPVVGENNEAISIRQNLQPAAPTTNSRSAPGVRQNAPPKKLAVYNEDNRENTEPQCSAASVDNHSLNSGMPRRLQTMEDDKNDRENRLDACRWNARHTQLENPAIPEPPEKLQLYVEPDVESKQPSVNQQNIQSSHRVLKERKEEPEVEDISHVLELDQTEGEIIPPVSAPAPKPEASNTKNDQLNNVEGENEAMDAESVSEESSKCKDITSKAFKWKMNYNPNKGNKNFYQNIKYKPLPDHRYRVNRIMLNADKWFKAREQKMKEDEENELEQAKNQFKKLSAEHQSLRKKYESEIIALENRGQELRKQLASFNEYKKEVQQKISQLEAQIEDLMSQLTKMTTDRNIQDTKFQRLQFEMFEKEKEFAQLLKTLNEEREHHKEELQAYKRKCEDFERAVKVERVSNESKRKDESTYEKEWSHLSKKQSYVDVDVRCRTAEISSSSPSSNQGDSSQFRSGETTVENNRSMAASSFMPVLDEDKSMMMSMEITPAPRKALGMVERGCRDNDDIMNMTPAAPPPFDFEVPPPPTNLFGGGRPKKFSLYESMQESSFVKPPVTKSIDSESKRADVVRSLLTLSENQAPLTTSNPTPARETFATAAPVNNFRNDEPFRRPTFDSDENAHPQTLQKPRRSMLMGRPYQREDSSDEDDDVILRRHQQTGVDLNISNLTTVLMLGPKPLTNSTPEKETHGKGDLPPLPPKRNLATHMDTDDVPPVDSHGARASRFSILNEPPLNLSTIQETSREYRSRSTTGSSSGGTTSMSTTRFGNATSTQLNGNSRSSSVPRSASRISQHNNNNGYFSDTNQ